MRWSVLKGDRLAMICVLAVVAGSAACWYVWYQSEAGARRDYYTGREILSSDPAVRRAAAWRVADEKLLRAAARIAQHLVDEPDASVREACVYALGRVGHAAHFDAAAKLLNCEPDPYVRYSAWLAAARMDAKRFRELVARTPPAGDAWDRIGRAYGFLEVGDLCGVGDLLELAETGDDGPRRAAGTALLRGVAPVLESVGRWPADVTITEGEVWPSALTAEVRSRLATLDAQRVSDELRRHADRVRDVRYLSGKLNIARDRLAWLLSKGAARP